LARAQKDRLFGELLDWRDEDRIVEAWRGLSRVAVESNPFYEPWTLLPALRAFGDAKIALACIWDGPARGALLGLAPVQKQRGYARLAVDYWTNWTHPHCFFGAPLMDRRCVRAVAEALLALLTPGALGLGFFRLRRVYPDAPAADMLCDAAARGGGIAYVSDSIQRAALFSGADAEGYLEQSLRKKKRKELARLRNRLAEIGDVKVRKLTDSSEADVWAKLFLELENQGWKGARGRSLLSSPEDAAWFCASIHGGLRAGKLDFLRMDCGGRPIAMLVSFGDSARYSVKIAHDPDFERYSPGLMIEIEATKRALAEPDFRFLDSCAVPDHPMINHLWRGRRTLVNLNFSGAGVAAKSVLRACRLLENARAAFPESAMKP
jgi:CelD/BcsL family acetyltransferase involved in cellulose biosynthesis